MAHKLITATKFRIEGVRASYAHLFEKSAYPGAEPKFSVSAIFSKEDKEALKVIEEAIKNAKARGVEVYGEKYTKADPTKEYNPLHDGDVEREEDEAYENSFFINASNKDDIKVLAVDGSKAEPSEVYSGCYGTLVANAFPYYTSPKGWGVSIKLLGFKKTADGDALGGARATASDFGDDEEAFLD